MPLQRRVKLRCEREGRAADPGGHSRLNRAFRLDETPQGRYNERADFVWRRILRAVQNLQSKGDDREE